MARSLFDEVLEAVLRQFEAGTQDTTDGPVIFVPFDDTLSSIRVEPARPHGQPARIRLDAQILFGVDVTVQLQARIGSMSNDFFCGHLVLAPGDYGHWELGHRHILVGDSWSPEDLHFCILYGAATASELIAPLRATFGGVRPDDREGLLRLMGGDRPV